MDLPLKIVLAFGVFIIIALVLGTMLSEQFSGAETAMRSFVEL